MRQEQQLHSQQLDFHALFNLNGITAFLVFGIGPETEAYRAGDFQGNDAHGNMIKWAIMEHQVFSHYLKSAQPTKYIEKKWSERSDYSAAVQLACEMQCNTSCNPAVQYLNEWSQSLMPTFYHSYSNTTLSCLIYPNPQRTPAKQTSEASLNHAQQCFCFSYW